MTGLFTGAFPKRIRPNKDSRTGNVPVFTVGPWSRPASIAYGCDALSHRRSAIPCRKNKTRLCRRGVAERGDDLIDDVLDQQAIVALAHHADHRLGAGR